MEPTNAVVFRDVSVRRSGLAILEHVNATVPQGSCTVIVGPNGAGKTTLILALIGEMRHDGDIDVMTGRSGKPLRLGYVPQRISIDRGMPLTVVEFLVMGIQKRPLWLGIRRFLPGCLPGLGLIPASLERPQQRHHQIPERRREEEPQR